MDLSQAIALEEQARRAEVYWQRVNDQYRQDYEQATQGLLTRDQWQLIVTRYQYEQQQYNEFQERRRAFYTENSGLWEAYQTSLTHAQTPTRRVSQQPSSQQPVQREMYTSGYSNNVAHAIPEKQAPKPIQTEVSLQSVIIAWFIANIIASVILIPLVLVTLLASFLSSLGSAVGSVVILVLISVNAIVGGIILGVLFSFILKRLFRASIAMRDSVQIFFWTWMTFAATTQLKDVFGIFTYLLMILIMIWTIDMLKSHVGENFTTRLPIFVGVGMIFLALVLPNLTGHNTHTSHAKAPKAPTASKKTTGAITAPRN